MLLFAAVPKVLYASTSVPITKPKFVLAAAGKVAPVPPFANAIAVPLQTPEVMVPTLVKLDVTILFANVVPVKFPAETVILISPVPSNGIPFIFFGTESLFALFAVPDNVPVIVPAVKFPLASLATIAFAVLVFVAVVAELATLPTVVIVPLNVPASTIILVVLAAVSLPFASTVKVGIAVEVPEELQAAITATSGSGPAYFFAFVEAMVEGAKKLGLSEEVATELVTQTIAGAAGMLETSGKSAKELRENVTSPNGTTFAALATFEKMGLTQMVQAAMEASAKRSQELA